MTKRPVSIAHLVFGLIFLGAAALWAIGASTGADAPDIAAAAPVVLIGAGVIGLAGIVVNARNARKAHATASADTTTDHHGDDTLVTTHEEQS